MINSVKILDCTLRDGGYVIDWMFGEKTIQSILKELHLAKIDYIECGFLKETQIEKGKTFFSSINDLGKFIIPEQKYTLMINFGEYDISHFSECKNKNIKIRIAFKKHHQKEALDYILKLKNLGWDVFANPMSTNTYSKDEMQNLIKEINNIKPFGITIVDTLGNMYEKQVIDIFEFIDSILDSSVALGFHTHNSMQLSFSNTQALLKMKTNRDIIIDSCIYGMGRGAGNLCTELIAKYLNDNHKKDYVILPLLKIFDNELKIFYEKTPWGYSTPYYIAAIHGCHPNYASFLKTKNLSDEEIDNVLSSIPEDKKTNFDKDFIKL
jgi:4-hydroxy 2-oxovalerate aldolase